MAATERYLYCQNPQCSRKLPAAGYCNGDLYCPRCLESGPPKPRTDDPPVVHCTGADCNRRLSFAETAAGDLFCGRCKIGTASNS